MAISYCYLVPFSKDLTFTFLFWKKEGNNNMQFCHLTLPAKVIQTLGNFVKLWNTTQLERKQLKCCRRASFVKKKKKKKKKKQLHYWFAAPVNITTPPITESKGESKRERDLQGGWADMKTTDPFCTAICHNTVDKRLLRTQNKESPESYCVYNEPCTYS